MTTENNTQVSEWKKRELGALWKKNGKTQNYFSGKINIEKLGDEKFVNIVGFSNKQKKDNPNAPDVIIYYSPSVDKLDLNNNQANESLVDSEESTVSADELSPANKTPEVSTQEAEDETPF